ncbi:MAG: hypothetical protein WA728_30380, partial [Xanthobacteraceae bacterium]
MAIDSQASEIFDANRNVKQNRDSSCQLDPYGIPTSERTTFCDLREDPLRQGQQGQELLIVRELAKATAVFLCESFGWRLQLLAKLAELIDGFLGRVYVVPRDRLKQCAHMID